MTSRRFGRYELLTTELPAARAFYTEVLGADFWAEDFTLGNLPEQARARGAKPHFRGHLSVADVESTRQALLSAGAMALGPVQTGTWGARAGLRDQFGAILTLTSEELPVPRPLVGWHLLAVHDHVPAFTSYEKMFGWKPTRAIDLGAPSGKHQLFSWDDSGVSVGSVSNLASLPEVHSQWLYFFRVADLERSVARVRELGGLALPPVRGADGAWFAACDDAQGGAFGLHQG